MKNFPNWDETTPEKAASGLERELAAAEKGVAAIEAAAPSDYAGLVNALDDATRPLWEIWGRVEHLLSVMNSDAWRKLEEAWQPKLVAFSLRVGQSKPIYAAAKRVLAGLMPAERVKRRIVAKMVQSAEHAGVGLEGAARQRFNELQTQLAKLGSDFSNAVIDATAAFKYEKDGKTYAIDDANYVETMKHCADREVRETLCRARATRAPENAARYVEILKLRRELAKTLGFETYADLSFSTKCAPSPSAALEMISKLDAATERPAAAEEKELAASAAVKKLEPWDRAFYAERLREKKYAYSEEELKRHFEFGEVLKGLFRITKFLYGVDVAEVTGAGKPSVWHPDVRFFAVRENGKEIAHFYVDPYVRRGLKRGGAWMNEFRNRRRLGDGTVVTPLALLVLNLMPPDAQGRTLLPMREVETLFHEFGHALQCMLTRVDEEGAAGISLVEWDAVEVASQFNENRCLDDRTGVKLPEELKRKVRAAKNFRAATACRRQLAFAETDLRLHGADATSAEWTAETVAALKDRLFAHYGLATVAGDKFLCAFTHIFAGGYAAGYYGYKWSEVMSSDCYGAFEEAGLADDAAVRRLGMKYRETVLALGGGESALDVFRKFRGRAPDITAHLRQQGLPTD